MFSFSDVKLGSSGEIVYPLKRGFRDENMKIPFLGDFRDWHFGLICERQTGSVK